MKGYKIKYLKQYLLPTPKSILTGDGSKSEI